MARRIMALVAGMATVFTCGVIIALLQRGSVAAQLAPVVFYPPQISPKGVTLTWSSAGPSAYYTIFKYEPDKGLFAPLTTVAATTYFDDLELAPDRYCWYITYLIGEITGPASNQWCIRLTAAWPSLAGAVENLFLPPSPSPTPQPAATVAAPAAAAPTATATPVAPAPTAAANTATQATAVPGTPAGTAPVPAGIVLDPPNLPRGCSVVRLQAPVGTSVAEILARFPLPYAVSAMWMVEAGTGRLLSFYFSDINATPDLAGWTTSEQQLLWICVTIATNVR